MQDTANNGGGLFFTAANSQALAKAFEAAIKDVNKQVGVAAGVSFNTNSLTSSSVLYLTQFNSADWSGDLVAYDLDDITGDINSTPIWNAADELDDDTVITPTTRSILTFGATYGVPFRWTDITSAQKNDLKTSPSGGVDTDTVGQARLDFLRGDRGNEGIGESFRIRSSRLGDVVHSSAVYVGKPEIGWPDIAPFPTGSDVYSNFVSTQESRTGILYVGANDGMLHGFRADTGKEVLAYIPSNLFSTASGQGLHYLTDPLYNHRYYVDLTPSISDVYVKTTAAGTEHWATILVGSEGGGGRGLFALDITDPSSFSETASTPANTVMWEFTSADDVDLGHTFSRPTIVLMNDGQWAVIFGNGYNDSGSGTAQLFIVFIEKGVDGTWSVGDYKKLDTGAGDTTDRNGLSTPAVVDIDGNGTADRAYAGDLEGNMWAFDLSSSTASDWEIAHKTAAIRPLFTAENNQAITTLPLIVKNPEVSDSATPNPFPNVLVLFGTGQYLVNNDTTTTDTQSFYGVWDQRKDGLDRTDLVEQTFEAGFPANARVLTDNSIPYNETGNYRRYGWYIDLPDSGERIATKGFVRGDKVYFNTLIPSTDVCSFGSSGYLMVVNYANGGRPDTATFDFDGDGDIDDDDLLSNSGGTVTDAPPSGVKVEHAVLTAPVNLGNKRYTGVSLTDDSNSGGGPRHPR